MPFQSEKQRRYLWANEPEIARDWADTYGSRIEKNSGGISQLVKSGPGRPGYGGPHETEKAGKSYERATAKGGEGAGAWQERALQTHRTEQQAQGKGAEQRAAEEEAKRYKESARGKKEIKTAAARNKKLAKIRSIKPKGHWAQKFGYGILPNDPKLAYDFLNNLKEDDKETWESLPQELKELLGTKPPGASGRTKLSFDNWSMIGQVPGYGDFLSERGKPGVKHSGNVGNLGERFVKYTGELDEFGKKIKQTDKYGNTLYGYHEPRGGDGGDRPIWARLGYGSESEWRNAGGGGGGGGGGATVPPVDEGSDFQDSLTVTADTPDYYVGQNPLASNIAWGKQAGVDPRTMGIYNQDQLGFPTWAAEGGRIPAAFGGIMDSETGRRAYGFGSFFKKIGRAAKKVLKSPIGKIGIGALAMGMPWGAGTAGLGKGWFGSASGWGKMAPWLLGKKNYATDFSTDYTRKGGILKSIFGGGKGALESGWNPWKIGIGAAAALPFFMGGKDDDEGSKFDYEGAKNAYRDELMRIKSGAMAGSLDPNKFNYLGVKEGGRIGLSNGGDPLLREEYEKYVFEMKEMDLTPMTFEKFAAQARAGMYAGGQSTPSDYTMEDARKTSMQDKMGGITDVMKHADLYRQGDVGQMYAADGGRIGYAGGSGHPPLTVGERPTPKMTGPQALQTRMAGPQALQTPMPAPQPNQVGRGMPGGMNPMGRGMPGGMNPMGRGMPGGMNPMGGMHPMMNRPMMRGKPMMGGRKMAQEGGLMDLGGMEKDYRNDGGFVPLGGEEKADDVPARLSKNEFVFTADAVRGAGDGDIDKGAEVMENIMKNLEQGGQISEETQGLSGAQEMFGVSERLSEVV